MHRIFIGSILLLVVLVNSSSSYLYCCFAVHVAIQASTGEALVVVTFTAEHDSPLVGAYFPIVCTPG